MGSAGKVVNLVVGKEVTTIRSQFQKSYIGTPTAKLSLTLEEGSKLSSVGNDAFKDNSFFVSIDLSNATQTMSFGDNAFNNMANLKEFSTGSGVLTLGANALSNLKKCETFTLGAEDVKLNTAIAITLTNPSTVATIKFGGTIVHTDSFTAPAVHKASSRYYLNGSCNLTSRSTSVSTTTTTNTTLTPVYRIDTYTHPLSNLGATNGCTVLIADTVKNIPASLFSAGVYMDVTTNLPKQSRTFNFKDNDNSKTQACSTYCWTGSTWTNIGGTVTVNGTSSTHSGSVTIIDGTTNTTDTPFKTSGIKITDVVLKNSQSDLASIKKAAFGVEERKVTTKLTATSAVPGTITYTSTENYPGTHSQGEMYNVGSLAMTKTCTTTQHSVGTWNAGTFTMSVTGDVRQDNVCLATPNSDVKSHVTDINLFGVADGCVIDTGAFAYNSDLTDIRLGSSVQTINDAAFFRAANNSTAYIYGKESNTFKPDSNNGLTSGGHSGIGTITYLPGAKDLGRYIAHYQTGDAVTAYLFELVDGTYVINLVGTGPTYDTYTESSLPGWHNDYGTKVSKVIVDDTVTSVGPYLFYGHTALTTVQFGSGLTSIGAHAFGSQHPQSP